MFAHTHARARARKKEWFLFLVVIVVILIFKNNFQVVSRHENNLLVSDGCQILITLEICNARFLCGDSI